MNSGFDEVWAESTVAGLKACGVEFTNGLSEAELESFVDRDELGFAVPAELLLFLRVGVPLGPRWPTWPEGIKAVLAEGRRWVQDTFEFGISNNAYWHPLFGERPKENDDAVSAALDVLSEAPPLIPIYGHRFLSSEPSEGRRAVLSIWQATDSIIYGNDLADYFAAEFGLARPSWAATSPQKMPVWEDLLHLFDESPML